ncbi:MAG: hypothetical protein IJA36_10285 [Lachnospiraceae bacterium]|nr:hypothetical protein [Lachnospiraceae bacterium]
MLKQLRLKNAHPEANLAKIMAMDNYDDVLFIVYIKEIFILFFATDDTPQFTLSSFRCREY